MRNQLTEANRQRLLDYERRGLRPPEERTTSVRRLKAAEDIATARAKDAADRYDQCIANPHSTASNRSAARPNRARQIVIEGPLG